MQTFAGQGLTHFSAASFGEMVPRSENLVTLDPKQRDAWGVPVLHIDCHYGEAELALVREQELALRELAEVSGVKAVRIVASPPGSAIHECGTARMGSNPASSVLDAHNECWDARGLFVTDGACFPSQGIQNPALTILALTARACDHAVRTKIAASETLVSHTDLDRHSSATENAINAIGSLIEASRWAPSFIMCGLLGD
jgi:choline dehydrogenase-like flavoprotein